MAWATALRAAPYAAIVVDARSGEVLHAQNADTRLHPASLTKMMTLYIAFEAIEHGEIGLDTMVTVSKKAASEPPSRLGLKPGQRIALRYLIRAAAVKSANDAATAIAEAIGGSQEGFARRMNRTAKALGMTRTTFRNAHGLTADGHLSTARDMTTLGRHLFYDYPTYYNLFSRQTADAGVRQVSNTNTRFLTSYRGADGIKTGYTNAAGFNLVASAERGNERIIATVFGGRSTAERNARVAQLLDLGFQKAPTRVAVRKPAKPLYIAGNAPSAPQPDLDEVPGGAGKTIRVSMAIPRSPRPLSRPVAEPPADLLAAVNAGVANALQEAQADIVAAAAVEAATTAARDATAAAAPVQAAPAPASEPAETQLAAVSPAPRPVTVPEQAATSAPPAETATADIAARPAMPSVQPRARPERIVLASVTPAPAEPPAPPVQTLATAPADTGQEIVTRMSSSGGRHWGINVGSYGSRYQADQVLLRTALQELGTLENALRKVVQGRRGFDANFVGMTEDEAALACRRLSAYGTECTTFGPPS